jgi:membrane protein YqaA with SNARE-associated domain
LKTLWFSDVLCALCNKKANFAKIFLVVGLFDYSLWGLFLASFLAATVVPFSSEAILSFLIISGTDPFTAVLVATAGNFLGGMSSFGIGYLGKWTWIEKYLHVKRESIEKWHDRLYNRGAIFAFLSWVPGVGDIFAVGLGLLRANVLVTAIAMLAGKFARYVVWGWLTGLVF